MATMYTIAYKDSTNLGSQDGQIHKNTTAGSRISTGISRQPDAMPRASDPRHAAALRVHENAND